MKRFENPLRASWPSLCQRPTLELEFLDGKVKNILNRVKASGDEALRELTLQFDKVNLPDFKVTTTEIDNALALVSMERKKAIRVAIGNITKFHAAQRLETLQVDTMPGVQCWRKAVPIEKVGIYIPGGTAPLFSTLLMLGIPAKLASCKEIVVCTPPKPDGTIDHSILFAAKELGITTLFKIGGAQAIAAMAFGTTSIPAASKIFGPGNQYVTKAKQLINMEGVSIDMPAGPSEVLIVADNHADASFIAADLLSQAEHGIDSQVVLISSSKTLLDKVDAELKAQLESLPRKDIATQSLQNSLGIEMENEQDIIDFVNVYAPEHLILNTVNCDELAEKVINAGSVFLGRYTPESVGDYASGTNHTLPTNGYAKAYSGVSLDSFQKYITFQKLTEAGLKTLGPVVEEMAEGEQLIAHKRAVSIRLGK